MQRWKVSLHFNCGRYNRQYQLELGLRLRTLNKSVAKMHALAHRFPQLPVGTMPTVDTVADKKSKPLQTLLVFLGNVAYSRVTLNDSDL